MLKLKYLIYLSICSIFLYGCKSKYVKALTHGEISSHYFNENIEVDVTNQLIIIPVSINNKTYRFLFDTGAPLSISKELQQEFGFKKLNKALLTDSDKSKSNLDIVRVDTISVGAIAFTNQTAFVGDFKRNAIIACLNIDGILGSNLMKHCNWTIDMQNKMVNLYKGEHRTKQKGFISLPFKKNKQYDIVLDLKIGKTMLTGIKLDYGSNGSLSIPQRAFSTLKSREFTSSLSNTGFVQSGLFGVRKPFNTEFVKADSLWLNQMIIKDVIIESGKSGLLGGKVLNNYIVNINWEHQTLSLARHLNLYNFESTFGFRVGYTDKLIIQSVMENTPAEVYGLKADMEILKIDKLDFTNQHSLCDYMDYFKQERHTIHLVYKTNEGIVKEIELTKKSPF